MEFLSRSVDTIKAYLQLLAELFRVSQVAVEKTETAGILLLVTEFAPAISGGVYRPAALARYAHQGGRSVAVVTANGPKDPSAAGQELLSYVGDAVEIVRYAPASLVPSVRLFPQTDGGMLNALQMVRATRERFGSALPGIIVASGPNFSSFIAGYLLARSCPEVRLILEYRDEWTECPFDFVSKSSDDRRWEMRCLARADRIIVTTESQRQHIGKVFGHGAFEKCAVYPNGWESSSPVVGGVPECERHARRIITFAGKLGGHTSPAAFLKAAATALAHRPDLRAKLLFRFIGAKSSHAVVNLSEFPYQEMIESFPVVPLADAQRMMRHSDALMLFHDQRFERYLPGKLYEYIASGLAILLVDDIGESSRLLKYLELGWVVSSADAQRLCEVFDEIVNSPSRVKIADRGKVSVWLKEHTRAAIARRFLEDVC